MKNIIRENKTFQKLYKSGKYIASKQIVLYFRKNDLGVNRYGITVGKKVGNSVERNRAKRLVRESYRLIEDKLTVGYDFVFVCRTAINECKRQDIDRSMVYVFNKAKLVQSTIKNCVKN